MELNRSDSTNKSTNYVPEYVITALKKSLLVSQFKDKWNRKGVGRGVEY